ncbi:MAG: DUF1963 domain-containing protein [Methylobacterium mesophilicum]|nr:DUF1963 domain-containing protein [Methylobacterium mesophilicum]
MEAGFDLDLPERGLLSFFEDATAEPEISPLRVIWIDRPLDTLRRRALPAPLVALADNTVANESWDGLTEAEVLDAHSALTLPHRWWRHCGPRSSQFRSLFHDPAHAYYPEPKGAGDKQSGYFGDRLGGWSDPIQSNPEDAFAGKEAVSFPGDDMVRHIFSWGGEYHGGTRRVEAVHGGDGTTYAMIARDDLLKRDFSRAGGIYQCD